MVFDIKVSYDWLINTYAIEFEKPGNGSCSNFAIYLPGSDNGFPLPLGGQEPVIIQTVGPLKSKLFRLHYDERGQEQVFEGLILELNLDHSPKRYTRQLSWLEILENWQRHPDDPSILIPFEDLEDTLADDTPLCIAGGNGAQEGELEEDEDIDVLNFYDMYRNFFEYRAGLLEAVEANDTRRLEQLIIKRPDSVYKLAGEAYTAQGHLVPRFIVLQECCLLLDACRGLTIDGVDKCVADTREWALDLRGNVCDKLKETEAKVVPDELLDWFEEESMKAWQD